MRIVRQWTSFTPVVLLAAGGCLATQSNIRMLQDQLASMQSVQARADSLRRVQVDSVLQLVLRNDDSVRALSARFFNFQAKTSGDLYQMNQQLVTIQELTGQNQRQVQRLRATLEEQQQAAAPVAAPATPGDTSHPAGPGPAVLFQAGMDQMNRASYGAARSAFQDLLTRFPEYDDAPAAQLYIGESFEFEKNRTAADSVYQLVARKYARSPRAATALYKYAQSQIAQGHREQARVALNRVIRDYPTADEVQLARDLLKTIK